MTKPSPPESRETLRLLCSSQQHGLPKRAWKTIDEADHQNWRFAPLKRLLIHHEPPAHARLSVQLSPFRGWKGCLSYSLPHSPLSPTPQRSRTSSVDLCRVSYRYRCYVLPDCSSSGVWSFFPVDAPSPPPLSGESTVVVLDEMVA
jgi:hypothetical protein